MDPWRAREAMPWFGFGHEDLATKHFGSAFDNIRPPASQVIGASGGPFARSTGHFASKRKSRRACHVRRQRGGMEKGKLESDVASALLRRGHNNGGGTCNAGRLPPSAHHMSGTEVSRWPKRPQHARGSRRAREEGPADGCQDGSIPAESAPEGMGIGGEGVGRERKCLSFQKDAPARRCGRLNLLPCWSLRLESTAEWRDVETGGSTWPARSHVSRSVRGFV